MACFPQSLWVHMNFVHCWFRDHQWALASSVPSGSYSFSASSAVFPDPWEKRFEGAHSDSQVFQGLSLSAWCLAVGTLYLFSFAAGRRFSNSSWARHWSYFLSGYLSNFLNTMFLFFLWVFYSCVQCILLISFLHFAIPAPSRTLLPQFSCFPNLLLKKEHMQICTSLLTLAYNRPYFIIF